MADQKPLKYSATAEETEFGTGDTLAVANGGTGSTTAPLALTALGAEGTANKGAVSGYSPLDVNQRVPRANRGTRVGLITVATATAAASDTGSDYIVCNRSATGAVAIAMTANPSDGFTVTVVDGKGDAATNNITLTAGAGNTIMGAATYVINTNYGSVTLLFSTTLTKWLMLAKG